MTKKRIVIFIFIVIAGCIGLGMAAYHGAASMEQGYKDVGKMNWSLKLSDKYTGITPSDYEQEFIFATRSSKGELLEGAMEPDGDIIVSPETMVIPAGDGWYAVTSDVFAGFKYKNIKGLTTEGWTYSDRLYFCGNYAIVVRNNGRKMIMNKQGDIVRTLKTKNEVWMISGDCYGMYDEENKRIQVLDIKTDEVMYENNKHQHISSLKKMDILH